jgi:hypothetical protein
MPVNPFIVFSGDDDRPAAGVQMHAAACSDRGDPRNKMLMRFARRKSS